MAFLKLNNWTIPVANSSARKRVEEVGRARRSSGELRTHRNFINRSWEITTTPLMPDVGEALEHWVNGRAHVWPFDFDHYSAPGGRPPVAGYTATASIVTGIAKFSSPVNQFLYLGNAGGTISFQIPLEYSTGNYTVSFWMWINDGTYAAWRHYVKRAVNGVVTTRVDDGAGPANPSNYTVVSSGGNLTFTVLARNAANTLNEDVWIEDLVMAPYSWTDAQITAVFSSTQAFGMAPLHRMTGDLVDEPGPVYVEAEMRDALYLQGVMSSSWRNNLRQYTFVLHESDPLPERTTP